MSGTRVTIAVACLGSSLSARRATVSGARVTTAATAAEAAPSPAAASSAGRPAVRGARMTATAPAAEQSAPAAAAISSRGASVGGARVVIAPPRGTPVGATRVTGFAAAPAGRGRPLVRAGLPMLGRVAPVVAVVLPGGHPAAHGGAEHLVPHRHGVPPAAARAVGVAAGEQVLLLRGLARVCGGWYVVEGSVGLG